ncbi:MAG: hypothetical protein HY253_08815 [Burkholderiales bacterium]|nr:hypothetical protein [Burkholderiales bacterium]
MRFDLTIDEPIPPTASALAQRRLFVGILISLVLHAIILSLKLGVPGLDFPDFELPWKKKRVGVINESLQVQIAGTAPRVPPVIAPPPTPAVTTSELFKFPEPILPAPVAKTSPEHGILVFPPTPKQAQSVNVPDKKSAKSPRIKKDLPTPIVRVPPPSDPSPRVIAQDQSVNPEFLIKQAEKEEQETQRDANKSAVENKDPIPFDAVIDKDAEQRLIDEKNRQELAKQAELAAKKAQDELRQKQLNKEIAEAQKKQIESALASQTNQVGQPMPVLADSMSDELKRQRQAAAKQASAALQKREEERALEEAAKETRRQELLTQETMRQEELRRQAEQQRQQLLALEQEKQRQQLAQLQKKQQEEEKQKQLALAEQQRQEEVRTQKILAQQLLEKKLAEQKLAEQKLAEQKLAEQKLAEQKLAEQKLAEQKLAEQKLAEQKLAEQKLAQQRADALAKQNADAANGKGNGNGTNSAGVVAAKQVPLPLTGGDLANRLREQARRGDVYKEATPTLGTANDARSRRRSFLGAYDKEVPLRMYVDGIKQKLERNGNLIYEKRSLSDVEHQVLINMVVRSDGSIEEVMILRSSGSRSIDERAKNIAITNAPFAVFPPALAAKYDVIEVQRLWVFGDRMRILENLPGSF